MADPRDAVDTLRRRIRSDVDDPDDARDVTDADAEALIKFSDQLDLLPSEYSDHRHLKPLRHCARMAEHTEVLADVVDDRDAAETVLRWINRE